MDKIFTKPDRPFLLLTEDDECVISYCWLESEEELQEVASERKECGEKIIDAIEIFSCRDVEIPPEYISQAHYINDTGDSFRCI